MSPDPYVNGLLDQAMPCKAKLTVPGKIVCVLHARAEARQLELCPYPSRAVLKNEIHELILTAEPEAGPGKVVNRIAYLAFFEVLESGILWVGDRMMVNGRCLGILAGYDFSHLPNHMNIILKVPQNPQTGFELGLQPGEPVEFVFAGSD
ncbi:MAG: hypothetical protein AB1522_01375 [Chloroflexota bacterium]